MWHFVSFAHPDSLNLQLRFEMKGSDQDAKLEAQNTWVLVPFFPVSNGGVQTSWGFLTLCFVCQIPIFFFHFWDSMFLLFFFVGPIPLII